MSAARLRALHVPGDPLLLPNAWDAASAKLVVKAGFPVVATGSAAVAEALGYADGHGTPPLEMFAAISRMTAVVDVPVTADIEGGYGLDAGELAAALAESGAVGCNFEDTAHPGKELIEVGEQARRVAALRAEDDDLVINARVDVFLYAEDQAAVLAEGIERARAYLDAGADCVYPILLRDETVLGEFVEAVRPAPVNATLVPGGPSLEAMRAAGVARISLGGGLFRLTQVYLEKVITDLAAGQSPY
jgi:2-methylisocitrate lyase-like PEP mutase family enzyme